MERKTKGTRQNIYFEVTVKTCNLLLGKLGVELNEDKQKKKSCLFDFNSKELKFEFCDTSTSEWRRTNYRGCSPML